jgi:Putative Flp pilus-assembly TadE/G-like
LSSTTDRRGQRGQVLVLFAGGAAALLIIAALAFDVGMMLVERRDQQNAADAAALAGARYVLTSANYSGDCASAPGGNEAVQAACDLAEQNGFEDTNGSVDVQIHIPAIHGRFVGFPGFVEVQIEGTKASVFGGIIGRAAWPVGTMAVAANQPNLTFPFAMLALNPTKCKAIQITGQGIVEAHSTVQSNSTGSDCTGAPYGLSRTGGGTLNVIAPDATCRSVGEIQDQGSGVMTCTKSPDSFALPDPLRFLDAPTMPGLADPMVYAGTGTPPAIPRDCPGGTPAPNPASPQTCALAPTGSYRNRPWVLSPGLYPGGLNVDQGTTAYLLPGIYWIGGGGFRTATGGSVISIASYTPGVTPTWGGGVLIYNSRLPAMAGGDISLGGSAASLQLKAYSVPTTDPTHIYNGIVIFQDRTLTETVTLNGAASTSEVEGVVYVPGGLVKLNGNGGTLITDQIIADSYLIDGDSGTIKVLRRTGVDAVISGAGLVD